MDGTLAKLIHPFMLFLDMKSRPECKKTQGYVFYLCIPGPNICIFIKQPF